MADYAGATIAIREKLQAEWLVTPITLQNETPADPFPPRAPDGMSLLPWVNLEVVSQQPSSMRGAGKPGNQVWENPGTIYVHVFVPTGTGTDVAFQYAADIGEIFRAKVFYQQPNGSYVRTWAPRIDGGGSGDDDGNWFRVTMSCPFEYWHIG